MLIGWRRWANRFRVVRRKDAAVPGQIYPAASGDEDADRDTENSRDDGATDQNEKAVFRQKADCRQRHTCAEDRRREGHKRQGVLGSWESSEFSCLVTLVFTPWDGSRDQKFYQGRNFFNNVQLFFKQNVEKVDFKTNLTLFSCMIVIFRHLYKLIKV